MYERWTRSMVRWRFVVLSLWILVTLLGVISATRLPALLSTSLTVPGSTSARANQILAHDFHDNIEGKLAVAVPGVGKSSGEAHRLMAEVRLAADRLSGASITQERVVDSTLYVNVDTPMSLAHAAAETGAFRLALRAKGVSDALVTGPPALQHDLTPILGSDLRRGEVVTLVVALLVLLMAFGFSWAVALPFLVAGATMSASLLALYAIARSITMVVYTPNIVELFGLGLAMDYSLLIVHRYRLELKRDGVSVEDAIVSTLKTAGRTVTVSAVAVTVSLVALAFVPVPFVRSLGLGALLVPIVGVVGALTLQPALLAVVGRSGMHRRGFVPSRNREPLAGWWARRARLALRRPGAVVAVSFVVLALLAASAWWLQLTPASLSAIPSTMNSAAALRLADAQVGPGFLTPIEIVIDSGSAGGAREPALKAARLRMAIALLHRSGVEDVAIGAKAPYLSASGRYERVFVVTSDEFGAIQDQTLIRQVRESIVPTAHFPSDASVFVGGAAAQGVDFLNDIYTNLAWILLFIFLATYLVLLRAFRSMLLPLLAMLLVSVSIAAAYGVLVAVFRFGVGSSWLGTYHVSQIEGWVPLLIFAVLFGLSMDYEVFIVSRIREAKDSGLDISDAIVHGLAHTGGVVGAAALIMVGAMAGMVEGHVAGLQELGVGLGTGVIVDVTVVRGLLLPAAMGLLGRWNWWLPSSVARIIGTTTSPPGERKVTVSSTGR